MISADQDGVARYFADIAARREASLTAAAATLARVNTEGAAATAAIERELQAAVATAQKSAAAEQAPDEPPSAGAQHDFGWPPREEDPEARFLQALLESEWSAGDEENSGGMG